jgi:anti-sigma B factor antagonist
MSAKVRTVGDVSIVELSGEFTLGRTVARPLDLHGRRLEDLGQLLAGLLERKSVRIVLDLERVRFMDSAGLGELVAWKKRALQLGGDVRLLHPRERVRDLFELTALTRVFRIFEDEAEAVASFRASHAS